ncbi:MAG: hypothetical protein LBU89_14980 [Fibromonadaceae bacterium]|jgi:hypothetical protein|nr:hypothetical protein [Fibromonadaceae bacterium]
MMQTFTLMSSEALGKAFRLDKGFHRIFGFKPAGALLPAFREFSNRKIFEQCRSKTTQTRSSI